MGDAPRAFTIQDMIEALREAAEVELRCGDLTALLGPTFDAREARRWA